MSRIHSHLLWLGLLADAFGFDALFMQCWRMREKCWICLRPPPAGE